MLTATSSPRTGVHARGRSSRRTRRPRSSTSGGESGRQVRITGTAVPLPEEVSQADWRARPNYSGRPNPDWQLYALAPVEFEFLQSRNDRNHTRVECSKNADGGWTHHLVTTPAG